MESFKGLVYNKIIDFLESQLSEKEFLALKKEKNSRSEVLRKVWVLSNDYPLEYWQEIISILEKQSIEPLNFMTKAGEHFAGIIAKQFLYSEGGTPPISHLMDTVVRLYPYFLSFGRIEFKSEGSLLKLTLNAKCELTAPMQTFFTAFFSEILSIYNFSMEVSTHIFKEASHETMLKLDFILHD